MRWTTHAWPRPKACRKAAISVAALLCAGVLSSCTPLGLNTASANIQRQEPASPFVLAATETGPAIATPGDWTSRRVPELRAAFERHLYGPVPTELKGVEIARRLVDPDYAGGLGTLEEIDVQVGEGDNAGTYRIALALPRSATAAAPAPLILGENFCGNRGTAGSDKLSPETASGACQNTGFVARIVRLIFGKYIIESPNAQILARGYAYANVFPSELVADNAGEAPAGIARFASLLPPDRAPNSLLGVWSASYGWSLDVLEVDPRIDANRTAAYGHSRHGKAALIAGALDPRIEAVISHQSGKGGATLTRSYAGETVRQITDAYGFWFAPAYAAWSDREADIPVDQHQLVAMLAPRPVLLGNGWKDVWSDPNGSFRAALGADPAYKLMGATGLAQAGMNDADTRGEIDFFIRAGGHGVRQVDWDHFLDFLDVWFSPREPDRR
ncbi:MAG: alpha/beta hydrolase [Alphaproteobacteria bacterium]|nr:alpha/beta hydrolase [Alphaproteobacteria bacterium]